MRRIFQKRQWLGMLLLSAIFGLSECKTDQRAKSLPPHLGEYVHAFTTGTISKTDEVRVQFAHAVANEDEVGNEVSGNVFSIRPAIKGKATWEDTQTILFRPADNFESGTSYVATVHLKKLFQNLPKDLAMFEFDFRTRDMYLQVEVEGLSAPDESDLSKQAITGTVYASDLVENEALEKVLNASQNGNTLNVTWSHESDGLRHSFTVNDVARTDKPGTVLINWSGKSVAAQNSGNTNVEVPALGDFKVMNAQVVQEAEQFILLHFSDPLLSNQELDGKIRLNNFNGYLRFLIDGNKLRIYPSSRLAGTYQLQIDPGVLNTKRSAMKAVTNWTLEFEQEKPAVRLVGKGVIMPNSSGLTFPFEAIGLNAVEVEIFKIYTNNMLQFLQVNEMSGSNELERVGRVILQKKVPLERLSKKADPNTWTRYSLDLSQMIKQDPSAIYQVRIGFRPAYSTFICDNRNKSGDNASNMSQVIDRVDENGEIISFWNDWYGIDGYYEDYSWEDREDPCKPAYYNSDNFISRNVFASDLGLTVKSGEDGSAFVAVAHLKTTEPVSGATIEFFDAQNQLIQKVQTDGDGIAKTQLAKRPAVLVASKGTDRGYLRLMDGNTLSLSKFDVAGTVSQKGIKGYLYGERGVWRPGDTLFLNFVLNDESGKLPPDHPVSLELYDARGQLQKKMSSTANVHGIYPLTVATDANAPTGNWLAQVKAGGAVFSKTLKIEAIKPNRLKFDLNFGKETLTRADDPLKGNLTVNWLHGAPAKNLKAVVEVQIKTSLTTFTKFPEYTFDDPARKLEAEPRILFDGNLDAEGKAVINADLLQNKAVPGKLFVGFKTRAFEKSGDFSSDNFSLPYYPFETFAGVTLPKNKWGQERFDIDREDALEFVAVDWKGNPQAKRTLEAGVYRIDWNWWWDSNDGNVTRFNSTNHFNAEQKTTIQTGANGKASWKLKFSDYGRYLVRVCDTESGHCAGQYFYVGYPWWDDEEGDGERRSDATVLAFTADKAKYNVGEKVELKIPAGDIGKVLLTLEDGSKVIQSSWNKTKAGENKLSFTTTKEMVPTVYAHVSMIQPHGQTLNDLPIRLYGVIPIEVEDPTTKLDPVLKMPEVLEPEKEVKIEVSEKNGKAMAYTIAMVDEGLLDLTRFKTPNPWDAFFAKEALGVKTWDLYDQVLGAFGGELERVLSIGGDDEATPGKGSKTVSRFKPVVKHMGPFYLKKGHKASHTVMISNYVGSVRTMVIAADKGVYGATDKTTPVRKPLMILPTLPRVLAPGETLQLPVNVFAMDAKVKNATVSVEESSGLVTLQGSKNKTLHFSRPGDEVIYFDLKVNEKVGIANFKIKASGAGESVGQDIQIEVRNPNPFVTNVISETVEPGKTWEPTFEYAGMAGTNSAILEVSSIPPIELGKQLKYLIQYPYGCLEQILSTGFPQLYVDKLLDVDATTKERLSRNVQSTIDKLKNFQNDQGGFSYWPGSGYYNHWANSYAGHFLVEAKTLGYTIPSSMLDRWENNQIKAVKAWDPQQDRFGFYDQHSSQLAQAYALYSLAVAGKPEMGAMNRMREMKGLGVSAKWRLAAAYAASGKPEIATQLVKGLTSVIEDYRELSYNFGSETRDRALILETLTLIGDRNKAGEIIREIAGDLSGGGWLSTQDIAYSLLAIGKFVGKEKPADGFSFQYRIGNGKVVNAGSKVPIVQVNVPANGGNGGKLFVKNDGKNILFARLILSGQPLTGAETSASNKLEITVNYRSMDGKVLDVSNLKQGTDFVAEVTVTHPSLYNGPLREMALTQIFPSGWEIINSRMDAIEYFSNTSRPKYQDIRDDRVNSFFDISPQSSQTYRIMVNAAYPGRYYLPAVSCAAMYDNSIYARQAGKWVVVSPDEGSEI